MVEPGRDRTTIAHSIRPGTDCRRARLSVVLHERGHLANEDLCAPLELLPAPTRKSASAAEPAAPCAQYLPGSPEARKARARGRLEVRDRRAHFLGAEHRVRTGDLRLGNEDWRRARSFPTIPESAQPCYFIRIRILHRRACLHGSSRGFSRFMCPICAHPRSESCSPIARCGAGSSAARLLKRPCLRLVRTGQAAALARRPQRDQVRLRRGRPASPL